MRRFAFSILVTFGLACVLVAQSTTTTVVIPAATPVVAVKAAPSETVQSALKMLQDMKAANEETLRKQAATIEQLDELEKAADQLRIYSKRS